MKNVIIVDAFGIIFKYYYALRLTNNNGENTACIFGFFNTILNLLIKNKPDYFVVALEGGGEPCFRTDIYKEYKANRPPAPQDLTAQIPKIIKLLEQLGIPHIYKEGFEADDIIGTLSEEFAKDKDCRVNILSADKDMRQLITDNIVVINPSKNNEFIEMDTQYIITNMGLEPKQVIDYLALRGDSADNIPGVAGIGDKYAKELLTKYGSIEGIYDNISNVSGKLCEKLIAGKEDAFLSKKLATIIKNVPIDFNEEAFKVKPFDMSVATQTLYDDQLNSIINKINSYNKNFLSDPSNLSGASKEEKHSDKEKFLPPDYLFILSLDDLREKIETISKTGYFAFDLETTGFDCFSDKIICMSLSTGSLSFVIPFLLSSTSQENVATPIDDNWRAEVIEIIRPIFESPTITKIGHNLKFDLKFLRTVGIEFNSNYFDTMLAEYCLDGAQNTYALKDIITKYFDYTPIKYEQIVADTKRETLLDVAIGDLVKYSGQDAFITYKLYRILREQITNSDKTRKLFFDIEMPLMLVLADMEYTGVNIDTSALEHLSKLIDDDLNKLTSSMFETVGQFNPSSPKQVSDLLFNRLALKPPRSAKKNSNGYSSDAVVLQDLASNYPEQVFPRMLLDYRLLSKVKTTYTDSLPKMVNSITHKIHTTFLQTGTQTGRLSSKEPNLQNIPVRTDLGRNIRKAFTPSDDKHILLSADYSQIEIFLLAEFSRDPNLVKAFQENVDVHKMTASLIFDKTPDEVTKQERSVAKTVNFGVLYGQSAFSLSSELKISVAQAKHFIDKYFEKYAVVQTYMQGLINKCQQNGYAETFCGRKRTIAGILDQNKNVASASQRMAVNTVIQGSAADLIKTAMVNIQEALKQYKMQSKLVLQVHDELIFDAKISETDDLIEIIKQKMEHPPFDFLLKLKTSIEYGENWGMFH